MKPFNLTTRLTAAGIALLLGACITGNDKNSMDPEFEKFKNTPVDPAAMGSSLAAGYSSLGTWSSALSNPSASAPGLPGTGAVSAPAIGALAKVTAEGDTSVTIVPVGSDRARVTFFMRDTLAGGLVREETAVVLVAPGPDGDYDTEADNIVYQADWNRKINGALKAEASYNDDDNDGIVVDNSTASKVRVEMREYQPLDRPWILNASATIHIRNLGYGLGNEALGFRFSETLITGRTNTAYLKNAAGGDEIAPNSETHLFLETVVSRLEDTLKSAKVEAVFNPGANLESEDDDSFLALHVETHKRFGFERDAEIHIVSDAPVPHGQDPVSGTIAANVTYANEKSASMDGRFSPDGFTVTFTGPEGNHLTVTLDKAGNVISVQ